MADKHIPDVATLRQLLIYAPETGKLFWRERPRHLFPSERSWLTWNTRFAGKEAFTYVSFYGYREGAIFGENFKAHRVIFAMVHGSWPVGGIDHIDGDRTNNRIANLREATQETNCRNQCRSITNKSGHVGVSLFKPTGRWHARIGVGARKTRHLGYFISLEDAIDARKAAERELGYHINHGRAK